MFDWITNPVSVFWVAVAAMCIVPAALHYMRQMKRDEQTAALKRDMIARGMSAEEIERVLAAKESGGGCDD